MTISIAMCTYNGARFIAEQIDSIIRQDRPPDELVVCDDGSTDETVAIVERCAERASFPVRIVVNPTRLGTVANFDQAIGLCSGDLIALSDQDDVWSADKLAVAERAFAEDAGLGGTFSDAELVDEALRPMGATMWGVRKFGASDQAVLRRSPADVLLPYSVVTGATLMFKSRFRDLVSPIPAGVPGYIHDRWIGVLIAATASLRAIPERLIQYRQHAEQQIGASGKQAPLLRERVQAQHDAYQADLDGMLAVHARLTEAKGFVPNPDFMGVLRERIQHLQQRLDLSPNLLKRAAEVAGEVASGRYHRFASGFGSAFKDLARAPGQRT